MISCPIGHGTLNVRELSFAPFKGRAAAIVGKEILILLTQDLGHSAVMR